MYESSYASAFGFLGNRTERERLAAIILDLDAQTRGGRPATTPFDDVGGSEASR